MEEEILNSLRVSIDNLIYKIEKIKTIEESDITRQNIIDSLEWFRESLQRPNFLEQLNNILFSLFPNVEKMSDAFKIIDALDEFQKDALIKTLVFYVINTETQTKYNKNLERIMRTIYDHICKMIRHNNDIFINKSYKEDLIRKFSFTEQEFIDILSRLGLVNGLNDDNSNHIKFDPEIENTLFDLKYFEYNNDIIQINKNKFTEASLFRLWLAWLAVNRNRITDKRFITGFCSIFADIILGAILPSIKPNQLNSKIRSSAFYNDDNMEIKPRVYSQKEIMMDVLFNLTRYVAYQFNGDGWANSIIQRGSTQGSILSTAFREEIRGLPAVKKLSIYIEITNLIIRIRSGMV
ncbi:MAG: hypothetical protein ACTSRP_07140 [Candidatus Helarchaeota archaeon]